MELSGLKQETLRHWRTVLSPLAKRKGSKCFSTGDVLALLIIKDITTTFNVQIKGIAPFAVQLFDVCNVINWINYKDKVMSINFANSSIEFVSQHTMVSDLSGPLILIDISRHIIHLKSELLGDPSADQLEMNFPPRLVVARKAA